MPDEIVNRAGTPSFNPNSGDPMATLQALLANGGAAPSAPAPQSTLQTILNSVAQGIGVGISNDPGQALLQQVQQAQQQRAEQERMAQQMQFQERMQNRQAEIGLLQDQIREQSVIKSEERAEKRNIAKEDRDYKRMIETETRAAGYDDKKSARDFEEQKKLTELQIEGSRKLAEQNKEYAQQLEILRNTHKKEADTLELAAALGVYGVSNPNVALEIARKRVNGESLTASESKELNKYFAGLKQERDIKLAATNRSNRPSGGGSGGSSNDLNSIFQKQLQAQMIRDMGEKKVELTNGDIVEVSAIPLNPLTGQREGIKRYIPDEENVQLAVQKYGKMIGLLGGQIRSNEVQTGPGVDLKTNQILSVFEEQLKQGQSKDVLMNNLNELLQTTTDPITRQAIQNAMIKGKSMSGPKSKPEPKPNRSRKDVMNEGGNLPTNLILPGDTAGKSNPNAPQLGTLPNQSRRQF